MEAGLTPAGSYEQPDTAAMGGVSWSPLPSNSVHGCRKDCKPRVWGSTVAQLGVEY